MSNFYQKSLVILPLFSILSLPPTSITARDFQRGIASLPDATAREEAAVESPHPRFDAWALRVDRSVRQRVEAVAVSYVNENIGKFEGLVTENLEKFKTKAADEAELKRNEDLLKSMVQLSLFIDDDLKVLSDEGLLSPQEAEDSRVKLRSEKDRLEVMLTDFESSNPALAVAEPEAPATPAQPANTVAVSDPVPSEVKSEGSAATAEPAVGNNHACEEKNKAITEQLSQLVNNQNQIMLAMMNLTQSMMSLMQQQQYSHWQQGSSVPYSHRYPYHAPAAEGNWVYYPHGFQPASSTQVPFHAPYPSTGGVYPENMNLPKPEVQNAPQATAAAGSEIGRAPGFASDGYSSIPYPGPTMTPNPFGSDPYGFNFFTN